jgi:hypothetical protein
MKTHKCVLVGYDEQQGIKCYHLCDRDIRKCLVSLNVTCDEKTLLISKQIENDNIGQLTKVVEDNDNEFESVYDVVESIPNISHQPPINNPIIPPLQSMILNNIIITKFIQCSHVMSIKFIK